MTITVGPTRQRVLEDGRHRTRVRVTLGDGSQRMLTYTTPPDVPFLHTNLGDLWLPPALLLAMRRREDLQLSDAISDRAEQVDRIQDILSTWYPRRMGRVAVTAPPAEREPSRAPWRPAPRKVTGSFFTGGVDSFHTLTKNRDRIGAIVYGFGVDVPLKEVAAIDRVAASLDAVARETGTRLLTARTTIRAFLADHTRWGAEAHGAALASLATLFSPVLDRVLVPATHSYRAGLPWGSHALLDPLWSTGRLLVEHDGGELGRARKVQFIADDPLAQRHLRVCYTKFATTNCCRCSKCLRTMANLAAVDRLQDFATFPEPLDLDALTSYELRDRNAVNQIKDLHAFVRRQDGHDELAQALSAMLRRADASRT